MRSVIEAPSSGPGSIEPIERASPAASPVITSSRLRSRCSATSSTVGRAPERRRELIDALADGEVQFFGAAWHLHRPGRIAEVALDLAFDRAAGEGDERHTHRRIEAVDRLHQRQHGDLLDVAVAPGAAVEASGDVDREPHVRLDDPVAGAPPPVRRYSSNRSSASVAMSGRCTLRDDELASSVTSKPSTTACRMRMASSSTSARVIVAATP